MERSESSWSVETIALPDSSSDAGECLFGFTAEDYRYPIPDSSGLYDDFRDWVLSATSDMEMRSEYEEDPNNRPDSPDQSDWWQSSEVGEPQAEPQDAAPDEESENEEGRV